MTDQLHDIAVRGFASDNYSGVHPEVLAAIAAANGGHQVAYGEDVYTERLQQVFAQHFGEGVEAFPVFNGTGANVTGLQSMLPRWGAVICASTAHINSDEGGAPERVGGIKLLTVARRTASSPPSSSTRRPGAGATSTARSRSSCRSRRPPSSARRTRSTRSARSPTTRTSAA